MKSVIQPIQLIHSSENQLIHSSENPCQTNRERCWKCKKKVRLLGHECLCSFVFCSNCRHAEYHGCVYNYEKAGKDEIKKNNPVVIADKMEYI